MSASFLVADLSARSAMATKLAAKSAALPTKPVHSRRMRCVAQAIGAGKNEKGSMDVRASAVATTPPAVEEKVWEYREIDGRMQKIGTAGQTGTTFEIPGGFRVEATKPLNYDYIFVNNVFNPVNTQVVDKYRQYGRCLVVADNTVLNQMYMDGETYGEKLKAYFAHHDLPLTVAGFTVTENEKTTRTLEDILDSMHEFGLNRQEPVLLIGGGLLTDIAGFACSQLRRNTPYCRIPTSLVGLIDASIAIKVAVNHGDLKNKLGGYHVHDTVFLDLSFLSTLPAKELRVGIAELIKIAVVADKHVFNLLNDNMEDLMTTKFGYVNPDNTLSEEQLAKCRQVGQEICEKGIFRMLELETPNLHEFELDREIAYGHTWGPVLELENKYREGKSIMHGHGVGMDMALSATIAARRGFIDNKERDQIISVISRAGLMVDHPIHQDSDIMKVATDEIVKTRNGLLRAAVPTPIGECAYINDLSHEELMDIVAEHKEICKEFPREGLGIDYYVEDKIDKTERFVVTPMDLAAVEMERAGRGRTYKEVSSGIEKAMRISDGVDAMVNKYSAQPSTTLSSIMQSNLGSNETWGELHANKQTERLIEMEMISGQAEAQFLKFLIYASGAKSALDVGTFTGYSAVAMAEALPEDGKVVTIEYEEEVAKVAAANFASSAVGSKIDSRTGDANEVLKTLTSSSESFDIVFVDAHKPDYVNYYKHIVDGGLLKAGGILVLDNTMYKGEELSGTDLSENGEGVQAVNKLVLEDARMHQVMLPLRDGVTVAYRMA